MPLLCGHEKTFLKLVADFGGIVRGFMLRNVREEARTPPCAKSDEYGEDLESGD